MSIILLLIIIIVIILIAFTIYKFYPSKKTGGSPEDCARLYFYLPELNCFSERLFIDFAKAVDGTEDEDLKIYADHARMLQLIGTFGDNNFENFYSVRNIDMYNNEENNKNKCVKIIIKMINTQFKNFTEVIEPELIKGAQAIRSEYFIKLYQLRIRVDFMDLTQYHRFLYSLEYYYITFGNLHYTFDRDQQPKIENLIIDNGSVIEYVDINLFCFSDSYNNYKKYISDAMVVQEGHGIPFKNEFYVMPNLDILFIGNFGKTLGMLGKCFDKNSEYKSALVRPLGYIKLEILTLMNNADEKKQKEISDTIVDFYDNKYNFGYQFNDILHHISDMTDLEYNEEEKYGKRLKGYLEYVCQNIVNLSPANIEIVNKISKYLSKREDADKDFKFHICNLENNNKNLHQAVISRLNFIESYDRLCKIQTLESPTELEKVLTNLRIVNFSYKRFKGINFTLQSIYDEVMVSLIYYNEKYNFINKYIDIGAANVLLDVLSINLKKMAITAPNKEDYKREDDYIDHFPDMDDDIAANISKYSVYENEGNADNAQSTIDDADIGKYSVSKNEGSTDTDNAQSTTADAGNDRDSFIEMVNKFYRELYKTDAKQSILLFRMEKYMHGVNVSPIVKAEIEECAKNIDYISNTAINLAEILEQNKDIGELARFYKTTYKNIKNFEKKYYIIFENLYTAEQTQNEDEWNKIVNEENFKRSIGAVIQFPKRKESDIRLKLMDIPDAKTHNHKDLEKQLAECKNEIIRFETWATSITQDDLYESTNIFLIDIIRDITKNLEYIKQESDVKSNMSKFKDNFEKIYTTIAEFIKHILLRFSLDLLNGNSEHINNVSNAKRIHVSNLITIIDNYIKKIGEISHPKIVLDKIYIIEQCLRKIGNVDDLDTIEAQIMNANKSIAAEMGYTDYFKIDGILELPALNITDAKQLVSNQGDQQVGPNTHSTQSNSSVPVVTETPDGKKIQSNSSAPAVTKTSNDTKIQSNSSPQDDTLKQAATISNVSDTPEKITAKKLRERRMKYSEELGEIIRELEQNGINSDISIKSIIYNQLSAMYTMIIDYERYPLPQTLSDINNKFDTIGIDMITFREVKDTMIKDKMLENKIPQQKGIIRTRTDNVDISRREVTIDSKKKTVKVEDSEESVSFNKKHPPSTVATDATANAALKTKYGMYFNAFANQKTQNLDPKQIQKSPASKTTMVPATTVSATTAPTTTAPILKTTASTSTTAPATMATTASMATTSAVEQVKQLNAIQQDATSKTTSTTAPATTSSMATTSYVEQLKQLNAIQQYATSKTTATTAPATTSPPPLTMAMNKLKQPNATQQNTISKLQSNNSQHYDQIQESSEYQSGPFEQYPREPETRSDRSSDREKPRDQYKQYSRFQHRPQAESRSNERATRESSEDQSGPFEQYPRESRTRSDRLADQEKPRSSSQLFNKFQHRPQAESRSNERATRESSEDQSGPFEQYPRDQYKQYSRFQHRPQADSRSEERAARESSEYQSEPFEQYPRESRTGSDRSADREKPRDQYKQYSRFQHRPQADSRSEERAARESSEDQSGPFEQYPREPKTSSDRSAAQESKQGNQSQTKTQNTARGSRAGLLAMYTSAKKSKDSKYSKDYEDSEDSKYDRRYEDEE